MFLWIMALPLNYPQKGNSELYNKYYYIYFVN